VALPGIKKKVKSDKKEKNVTWDGAANSFSSVAQIRTNGQLGSLTDRHLGHSLVPPTDHFTFADLELEGLQIREISKRFKLVDIVNCACG